MPILLGQTWDGSYIPKYMPILLGQAWDGSYNSYVEKEYTTPKTSTLFPNLLDKKAEALRRVHSKMFGLIRRISALAESRCEM